MITALLQIIGFVLATLFMGFNIVVAYDKEGAIRGLEAAGLSYLFGIGAIAIEMFAFGLFGAEFAVSCLISPWIILFAINIPRLKLRLSGKRGRPSAYAKFNLFETVVAVLLAFVICYAFFMSLIRPVESYDGVAMWSLKAKVLYMSHTVPPDFFTVMKTKFDNVHTDYPLLVPLSEAWFYTFINNFNDHLVKVLFPLNYLAFLTIFYSFLKKAGLARRFALVCTFFLASVRQFTNYAANDYADMQMAIYGSLTFLAFYLYIRERASAYFWTSLLACLFAMWTKNEGAVILSGLIIILCIYRFTGSKGAARPPVPYYKAFLAAGLLVALLAAWYMFKSSLSLDNVILNSRTFEKYEVMNIFKRLGLILYEYQRQIFGVKYWNLAWIFFILFLCIDFRRIFTKENRYITLPVFIILSAYTFIYLITPLDLRWHLRYSASRLILHILPLAVFYIALEAGRMYRMQESE